MSGRCRVGGGMGGDNDPETLNAIFNVVVAAAATDACV